MPGQSPSFGTPRTMSPGEVISAGAAVCTSRRTVANMKHTRTIQSPASKALLIVSITHPAKQHSLISIWYHIFTQNVSSFRLYLKEMTLKTNRWSAISGCLVKNRSDSLRTVSLSNIDHAELISLFLSFRPESPWDAAEESGFEPKIPYGYKPDSSTSLRCAPENYTLTWT